MPIFPPRRMSRIARRRRASSRPVGLESLEARRLLASSDGYIKIDLANLDQTGLGGKYPIYMLGYASSSGQILQQDPSSGKVSLGMPVPAVTTVPVTSGMASGSSVTLSTSANLFVGGGVKFSDGTTATIASISANVVIAAQQKGSFVPVQPFGWTANANVAVLGAASVNQGTVSNLPATPPATSSQVTGVPIAAGSQSGIRLGSVVTGYVPPSGASTPTANASVSGKGEVTGFSALNSNSVRYQYAPTVTFPANNKQPIGTVAVGLCTLDANGFVNGVTFTPTTEYPSLTAGTGYSTGSTYPATFSNPPGNIYFYPTDANGFPGTGATNAGAASVTSLSAPGATMTIDVSKPANPPTWSTSPPIPLGTSPLNSALNVYTGGTNPDGFATFLPMATVTVQNQKLVNTTALNTAARFDAAHPPTMTVPTVGILASNYASGTPTLDASGRLQSISFPSNAFAGYANGTYSVFGQAGTSAQQWTTPSFTIGNLPSTTSVQSYNTLLDVAGSSLAVAGVPGTSTIYAVPSYTITFNKSVPAGTTKLDFSPEVQATVSSDGQSFTISAATYPGIATGLAIGMTPTITLTGQLPQAPTVNALSVTGSTITVALKSALSAAFRGQTVQVALPPTGGSLPVVTWNTLSQANQAVWATQTPNATKGSISVNGARIYFVLDTLQKGPPAFNYSVGVNANGQETITVTQPPDELVWKNDVSPFQYVELTADALPQGGQGGDGNVYVDLSAVDGFFFPAALSTKVNQQTLLMGQPWQTYPAPNTTGPNTYNAVTRTQILDAWNSFFKSSSNNFSTTAAALQTAYAGLQVTAGIQNPSFAYATPTTSIPAFDGCWTPALDALFKNPNQIDLEGDLTITSGQNSFLAYYKGSQVTKGGYPAIEFTEYRGDYNTPTGATFWVYDPRKPPSSEVNAFAAGKAMSPGYQVFANTGVFNSNSTVQSGNTPNYAPGSSNWGTQDALKQLLSLERQVVTALNRGVGQYGIGSTGAAVGRTTTYWNAETNWYPYLAPYGPNTPQNIFSQWVHTAVIDQATSTYFATYPLGTASGYGNPTKAWGAQGAGTGPFMNQTYGFGYDETPGGQANVPSKFLPILNSAGNENDPLTFQLVFGPWDQPTPSAPYCSSIDTIPAQSPPGTPTPTTATTLSWTVSFNEPVKGVTLDDFTYTVGPGPLSFEKKSVTANSGTALSQTWTVTGDVVGTGSGMIGMNLTKAGSITDASGTPLTLSAMKMGETYNVTVNPVGPTAAIVIAGTNPTNAATVPFTVTFSQPVTGLTTANFTTVAGGAVTQSSVQSVSGSGTTYTVVVNTGSGSGTLALKLASATGITPAPSNVGVTSAAYTIDKNAPTAAPRVHGIALAGTSPTSAASVSWTVTFTEPVTGLTAANFALVNGGLGGAPAITSVSPVPGTNTATWTVTASTGTGTGTGTLGLNMVNSTGVRDADLQAVTNVPYTGSVYTVDRTAPAAQSIQRANASPTSLSAVSWTVTFSKPVAGLSKENFQLAATGLKGAQVTAVAPAGGSAPSRGWTVTAATGSGSGTLRLDLENARGITDAVGLTPTGIPLTGQAYTVARGSATIVDVPIAFMTTMGTTTPLRWLMNPFTDADSTQLTATLSASPGAASGTFRATSGGGVTVAPSGTAASELTFTGTLTALNAYFRNAAGLIRYTPTGSSLAPRSLTLSAQGSDGLSGFATAALLVRAASRQSPAPTLNASALLAGTAGRPLVITYAQLVAATGATQTTSRSVQFMLAAPPSGRLEVWNGGRWTAVPSLANIPLLAPGGRIRWTPPTGVSGTRPAFAVKTWDGWQMSRVSQVSVNLAR